MKNIYKSLTEDDGEEGILKNLIDDQEMKELLTNPFHITGSNIKVTILNLFRNEGILTGSNIRVTMLNLLLLSFGDL